MKEELKNKVKFYKQNYISVVGKPFKHFMCPITKLDKNVELCLGHVVNERFCNVTVPQVKSVDGFYGRVVEADFLKAVEGVDKNVFELFYNKELCRKYRPKLMCGTEVWEYYFTKSKQNVLGHTSFKILDDEDGWYLSVKQSPEKFRQLRSGDLKIYLERDYRPAVIATLLKSAYLTMFYLTGYDFMLTTAGLLASDILNKFYLDFKDKDVTEEDICKIFLPCETMMAPLANDDFFEGTVNDNYFLTLWSSSNEPFAMAIIIKAGIEKFCVFFPTSLNKTIDVYQSFLKEPPPSVQARLTRFNNSLKCFEVSPKHFRIPLNQTIHYPKKDSDLIFCI